MDNTADKLLDRKDNNSFLFYGTNKIPILFMLMGLPASGKSTIAKKINVVDMELKDFAKPIIYSSDNLRLELFGDINDQKHNQELFDELHKRIKNSLLNNKSVIYDATNINKKRRIEFLKELSDIDCYKVCFCILTPYENCLENNNKREKKVPKDIIKKMYLNWQPPSYSEGFNNIILYYNIESQDLMDKYDICQFFKKIKIISQENKHHTLTIGDHCLACGNYLMEKYPENSMLHKAGYLHDIGKVFTKSNYNAKGEIDGDCHYYNHQNVGAYESLFFTKFHGLSLEEQLTISNLIYYHMLPFSWKETGNISKRLRLQMGEEMYEMVCKLHEADLEAE